MPEEKSDEDLMIAYQLGDESAFRELYKRHAGRVFSFIKSKSKDDAFAWDVFQSTFMKLHKSRSLYKSKFQFLPWLFTICRSEIIDAFRKNSLRKEDLVSDVEKQQAYVSSEDADLSELSTDQRKIIEMRYKDDLSFEEIAAHLRTSPTNARKIVSRAIKALRKLYGKE
jgi:RNA polymerase sigma-70 factor (ECF subfamily)